MKLHISDLIDLPMDIPPVEDIPPLNQARIRELTLEKINNTQKKAGHNNRSLLRLLTLAAVLSLLVLTVTAQFSGAGDWFREILNHDLQENNQENIQQVVTDRQTDLVTQLGQAEPQTIQSNGSTLTLNAYYGDSTIQHLYFRLEAPAGTCLPDDILYRFYTGSHNQPELHADAALSLLYETEALPDDNSEDNKKDFHVTILPSSGNVLKTVSEDSFSLHIGGLYEQVLNQYGDEDAYRQIAAGDFLFTLKKPHADPPVEISMDGMAYSGVFVRNWTHPDDAQGDLSGGHFDWCPPYDEAGVHTEKVAYEITPIRFSITPLIVRWESGYKVDDPNYMYNLSYQIVLKDGTTAATFEIDGGSCKYTDETNTAAICSRTDAFVAPLDFEQVDYILIGNPEFGTSHKIDFSSYLK